MVKEGKKEGVDVARPPIVVVLGHVDHGKTTLLDAIRKTRVAKKEAGGITQSIGASVLTTESGEKITFVDTPGHAAFSNMRSHGAKVADLAVLVVALDDGVKPQTKEVLDYIREVKMPYLVAATKSDLLSASKERLISQLGKEGVKFEGRGGDVPLVLVSAKKGEGISELLEMITLVYQLNRVDEEEVKFEGYVIETRKDKRGPLISIIIKGGEVRVGDRLFAGKHEAKVKAIFNDKGKSVRSLGAGEPALILGFSNLPSVGSKITAFPGEEAEPLKKSEDNQKKRFENKKGLSLVVKAKTSGSLEAVLANLPDSVCVIASGVGDVTDSDIFMAKSVDNAPIVALESGMTPSVGKLAKTEGVPVYTFDIVYKLFEKVEELIKGGSVEVLGRAEVLASFPFNKKRVAGGSVLEGRIAKGDLLVVARGNQELGEVKAVSLKREKKEIDTAKAGEEFGVIFEPQLDFKVGDMIVSVNK